MPSILNLKFKGNKSFIAFSNLADTDSLTSTWKVCTKVASYLEQGQRLENLSWRLWHLQNLMVDTDNAKSKREFKKLSKCMGDKLDKEKGRSIEELEAPDFKRNHSTDLLRQRAVERERSREASQNAKPGTIKRMQFTFSVDRPMPSTWTNIPVTKPDMRPSSEFRANTNRRGRASTTTTTTATTTATTTHEESEIVAVEDKDASDKDPPLTERGRKPSASTVEAQTDMQQNSSSLVFPSLFSSDFNPTALLYPTPSHSTRMNYGEGVGATSSDGFSISRPTIELPLDDILIGVDNSESWISPYHGNNNEFSLPYPPPEPQQNLVENIIQQDVTMHSVTESNGFYSSSYEDSEASDDDADDADYVLPSAFNMVYPHSQSIRELDRQSMGLSRSRTRTPVGRPSLTVKTDSSKRSSALGATATSLNPAVLKQGITSPPPPGAKAECSNCGATHTPLWRRGLNDELNCNACGLYCKLHKRPRPKSMRNTHGEGRVQATPRQEIIDVMVRPAQCYNCHTTATPLWRKDDEGKTVCNACGLYYKLHGASRPISMKSDIIRKRSRHEARRPGANGSDTPSASRGGSPGASPDMERSPTLAPDSTTQMMYEFSEDSEFRGSQSELMGALGNAGQGSFSGLFNPFPGPYHPDYLLQQSTTTPADALPFASVDNIETEAETETKEESRTNKRRRMSTESASEPPSSAVSYNSYNEGFSSQSSATSQSQRSSMDFPFNQYSSYNILRGSANTFWHPPMVVQDSPRVIHPPMLPSDDSHMDYLHPPMLPQEEENLFNQYLHPPILPTDESSKALMNSLQSSYAGNGSQSEFYDATMNHY